MTIKNKRAPGRRKKVYFNKGRQVDKLSLNEANGLLTNFFPLKKDMLIEYLHLFNDKYNGLYARHLRALAELMKLSMAEVYEVASFYAHFHLVDGENITSPEITIKVCDSVTCAMNGAEEIYKEYVGIIRPRVVISGKKEYLNKNSSLIRALLLSGIRAAFLWDYHGGSKWHLMFRRKEILNKCENYFI